MKLRYVFPLMFAAAVGGWAVAYFRADIERLVGASTDPIAWPEGKARQIFAAEHKRHYSNIADALIWLCSYDGTVRQTFREAAFGQRLAEIENEWHTETERLKGNGDVTRVGPRLVLSTAAQQVEFVDSGYLCGDDGSQTWRYEQRLPKSDLHVINRGAQIPVIVRSVLVSPRSGKTAELSGVLLESPSGKRVAGFAVEEGDSGGLLEIVRVDSDALKMETIELGNNAPVGVIGWIDDASMLLVMSQNRQAKLIYRDGRWHLEYLNR